MDIVVDFGDMREDEKNKKQIKIKKKSKKWKEMKCKKNDYLKQKIVYQGQINQCQLLMELIEIGCQFRLHSNMKGLYSMVTMSFGKIIHKFIIFYNDFLTCLNNFFCWKY